MKLFVVIIVSFLTYSCTGLSQVSVEKELKQELEKMEFPSKQLSFIKSGRMPFNLFSTKVYDENILNDTLKYTYHYALFDFQVGYFYEQMGVYFILDKRNKIVRLYVNQGQWYFYPFVAKNATSIFEDRDSLKDIFNSTELVIYEIDSTESIIGTCFDSIMNEELSFSVYWGVSINNEIFRLNDFKYLNISNSALIIPKFKKPRPILNFKTTDDFQYTYGVDSYTGKPNIVRYREVYYDINSKKIIKDQLSSEFIYLNVDRW